MRWSTDHFYLEATQFIIDRNRNGYRLGAGVNTVPYKNWVLSAKLNYADGPFSAQEAVIGKLAFTNSKLPFLAVSV